MLMRVDGQYMRSVPRRRGVLLCPRRRTVWYNERGYRVGESHHKAKLTWEDVDLMRTLREPPHRMSLRELAVKFGVAISTASDICNYRIWAQETVREREVVE